MKGHKWQLFVLDLSFIGWAVLAAIPYCAAYFLLNLCISKEWAILVAIPFGLGLLWLIPYIATTNANFYQALTEKENK